MPAHSKALCRTSGDTESGHDSCQPSPAHCCQQDASPMPNAQGRMAAPLQHEDTKGKAPSGRFWVCSCKPFGWWGGTWGQGVAKQQGSTALRARWLRHYRQTDGHACQAFSPLKLTKHGVCQGGTAGWKGPRLSDRLCKQSSTSRPPCSKQTQRSGTGGRPPAPRGHGGTQGGVSTDES